MRARLVEPEHGRRSRSPARARRRAAPSRRSARPWSGTRARCRRPRPRARAASSPARVDDADGARGLDLERLVVAAVLLGLLRHQADVRRRAHRRRIERAVLAAEVDRLGVQRRVAGVGDDRLGVLLLAVGVPHLAGRADHRRHRRVDDHVARDVQVGDPAVGVDHREARRRSRRPPGSRPRSRALVGGQRSIAGRMLAEAVVRARADARARRRARRTRPRRTRARRGRR